MPQKSFTKLVIFTSFILSAIFGGYLIYQNIQNENLAAQQRALGELQKMAKGEMAAFLYNAQPMELPKVEFLGPNGEDMDLSHFKGKTILVNLWATWCGPCRFEMPTLDQLQAKLGGDNFEVVTLNVDRNATDKARAFFEEIEVKHLQLYADPSTKAMRTLRARGLPMTMLINAQGQEVGRMFGPAEWMSEEAINLIQAEINSQL
ncbi:MAG: TlpA family protein disulfide reductase [Rhizobiales bacterium]|nr:TlpA family protein disulfide reductase [Hyphomicrobiales bacterium]NRB15713.1 TlpA family protein disulfide reductase [Hyphomicrobiales bacterium]